MEKIKKGYNLKIASVIISIVFLYNTALYSYIDSKDTLRVPLASSSKEGHDRFGEAKNILEGEPNELSGIIAVIGSILMSYQCDGRKSALAILEELKKAGVDEKCFILMKEPNMVLRYRSFIEFYKKQKDDLRLVSLEELRQRFIEYLGEIVIYRADLYAEKKMQEVREFGCLSKFLKGNGTFSEMAKIISKLGILCTVQATMDEERVILSSGEVLYDGRKGRLYNSVSIVDPGAKDQRLAEKRAEALARQVANYYVRGKSGDTSLNSLT